MNSYKKWPCLLLVLILLLGACSSDTGDSKRLPTLGSTVTPLPHATATFIPMQARPELPVIDWANVSHMASAMRADYQGDVEAVLGWANRYYIEATLELGPAAIITGSQRVLYTNWHTAPIPDIVFRLYPNFSDTGSHLRVTNVTAAGQPVNPTITIRDTVMTVPLDQPLLPGESVELTMDFMLIHERGVLTTDYGFKLQQFQMLNWFPALSVYEGPDKGWWQTRLPAANVDNFYSEIALYDIKLTHHEKTVIAISGVSIDTESHGNEMVTEHIVTGPQRDNFMVASTNLGKITDEVDGTKVNVYFFAGGERAAEWAMEVGLRSIAVYNRAFGDYPYAEMDIVQSYHPSGVEFPGITMISTNMWQNGSPTLELVIAHEVGHQWWYGVVGNNNGEEPWLDESLTSFTEGIYYRNAYNDNEERYRLWLDSERNIFTNFLTNGGNNQPMNQSSAQLGGLLGIIVYVKGSNFYHELEVLLGREVFIQALQNYYADMKYKLTSGYDILRHFEAASGQDLDQFFYEWVGYFDGLDPAVYDSTATARRSTTNAEAPQPFRIGG